jgi:hypothetical protein
MQGGAVGATSTAPRQLQTPLGSLDLFCRGGDIQSLPLRLGGCCGVDHDDILRQRIDSLQQRDANPVDVLDRLLVG